MKEQIEEMAKVLIDYTKKKNIMASHVILEDYAEQLYNAGYRKQSESEWLEIDDGVLIGDGKHLECSECGVWKKDRQRSNFCSNCGAKMKGDKNEQREAD